MVSDDDEGTIAKSPVAGAAFDGVGGRRGELTGRAGQRLRARDVQREERDVPSVDHLPRNGGGRRRVRGEGPRECPVPRVHARVRVVVAGDERDALRIDAGVVERFGERLELGRRADLGQVTGDDDVIGMATFGRSQRELELASTRLCVERSPEAHEAYPHRISRPRPARTRGEHVHVGHVRDARNGRFLHCLLLASWSTPTALTMPLLRCPQGGAGARWQRSRDARSASPDVHHFVHE